MSLFVPEAKQCAVAFGASEGRGIADLMNGACYRPFSGCHSRFGVMLGTQRPGVTIALQALAQRGLISAARGRIIVVNREGLEESANGLYGVPEAEYDRLFQST